MIQTRRSPFGRRWPHPDAWEARAATAPNVMTYVYARTKRKAIKKLKADLVAKDAIRSARAGQS